MGSFGEDGRGGWQRESDDPREDGHSNPQNREGRTRKGFREQPSTRKLLDGIRSGKKRMEWLSSTVASESLWMLKKMRELATELQEDINRNAIRNLQADRIAVSNLNKVKEKEREIESLNETIRGRDEDIYTLTRGFNELESKLMKTEFQLQLKMMELEKLESDLKRPEEKISINDSSNNSWKSPISVMERKTSMLSIINTSRRSEKSPNFVMDKQTLIRWK